MKLRTNPLIALPVAALVPPVAGTVIAPPGGSWDWLSTLAILFVVYIYSLMAVALFGLTAYSLLLQLGWARWWTALAAGLLGGAIVGAKVWKPYASTVRDVPVMALTGALTALVFWWLLRDAYRGPAKVPRQAAH